MKKPWGGRFQEATRSSVENFTESLSFDHRLYPYDIQGSIAHAGMLGEVGLIGTADAQRIIEGLKEVARDIEAGKVVFDPAFEDIHMLVEHLLTEKIGPAGKKLHTARSRNDQVATDIRLWLKDVGHVLHGQLRRLQKALLEKAVASESLIMPGFTHLQHAQPVGVAFYLLAFLEKFDRDCSRLEDCLKRADVLPLGACALAGTTLTIDRTKVAESLEFGSVSRNSMDSVSDRDFLVEYAFVLSLIATHISNFCEDMIIWASAEYAYITIDDGYCTGSSIMPQKKNPDVHELLRGKTARVHAALYALLTLMKGLPQAYNRDMQEDKERIFDAHDTVFASVSILTELIAHTHFNKDRLLDSTRKGFMEATALAEYLVARGIFFRDAHHIAGTIVKMAETSQRTLAELELSALKTVCPEIDADVFSVLSCDKILDQVVSEGGTGWSEIRKNLTFWEKRLSSITGET
ncbi:MAG: argininosuccinate lyase [Pseudomonadota bacterium]